MFPLNGLRPDFITIGASVTDLVTLPRGCLFEGVLLEFSSLRSLEETVLVCSVEFFGVDVSAY